MIKLVYALYDNVSKTVMDYHIVDNPVWAERMFRKMMQDLKLGVPAEYSYKLVAGLNDLQVLSAEQAFEDYASLSGDDSHPALYGLEGKDYVKMENDV